MGTMMMLFFGAASLHMIVLVGTAVAELAIANKQFGLAKSLSLLITFIALILVIISFASSWFRGIFICCGGHLSTITYAYVLYFMAYCIKLGVSKSRDP